MMAFTLSLNLPESRSTLLQQQSTLGIRAFSDAHFIHWRRSAGLDLLQFGRCEVGWLARAQERWDRVQFGCKNEAIGFKNATRNSWLAMPLALGQMGHGL
ncbi:hypothetical protein H0G86_002928 [Trichoderma simmonsii]|uniref:Uncharacterized protein n=1 Tax=Trichoderma simmonsii TaxID=1491479 RepID=A0A8G0L7M0_9HYPO|nr:hypothetical protein H0G86_002928 [Trichoderma simmonsii]